MLGGEAEPTLERTLEPFKLDLVYSPARYWTWEQLAVNYHEFADWMLVGLGGQGRALEGAGVLAGAGMLGGAGVLAGQGAARSRGCLGSFCAGLGTGGWRGAAAGRCWPCCAMCIDLIEAGPGS